MPLFDYRCETCSAEEGENVVFERLVASDNKDAQTCPYCDGTETKRMIGIPSWTMGLTANQKSIGVTKDRLDKTNYTRDMRTKRKKEFGSGTREGTSNELWTGGEWDKRVWKGPSTS